VVGVRVKVEIEYCGKRVVVTALVNTGFEGDVPEILIPISIAERLGIWPRLPESTIIETYKTASGLMRVYRIPGAKVRLVVDEETREPINSFIVISEYTDEALINDQLISAMGIIIEDPAKGLWKLRGENKIRRSVN
jgi:predicted aspartyl protease